MPFARENVTAASRIMLPTYIAMFTAIGATYLLTPVARLNRTPGLAYANDQISVRAWGLLFLAAAAMMSLALLTHRRTLYQYALLVCVVAMTLWAVTLAAAAVNSTATVTAWCWPAFIAVACYASYRSLSVEEV
jgi:hypothetical protein